MMSAAVDRRRVLVALALLVLVSTVARLGLGLGYFGFSSGDDVEILEEGFRRVLDLDYSPLPIRNLLLSDLLVAPTLGLASAIGVSDPTTLAWLATWPFVALASLNILLVFAIALRWLGDGRAALLAATLYAVHWIPLGYGSTVYPRTASTSCFLLGVWLLAEASRPSWRAAGAGALGALAFTFRYSEGVVLAPLAAALLWRDAPLADRARRLLIFASGFVATSLVTVGLYDWLTWGSPFRSFLALTEFVVVRGQTTAESAVRPWYWYGRRLPKWLPLTLLPFLVSAGRSAAGRRALLLGLLPFLLLSAIRLKGMRYLQAVIPFVCLAAACGALLWWRARRRRTTAALLALSLVLSLGGLTFLQKKSMAAVEAARFIAAESAVDCVALAQPWAYGDRLFLRPGTEVRRLEVEPSVAELEQVAPGCDRVALYADHVARTPPLASALERLGFEPVRGFRWGRSREVNLYAAAGEPTGPDQRLRH